MVMVTSFGTLEPAAAPLVAEGAAMTVHGSVVMGKALLEFSKHKEGKYEGEKKHGSQKLKNVAQHNKLSAGEIKKLKDAGHDIHILEGSKNAFKV